MTVFVIESELGTEGVYTSLEKAQQWLDANITNGKLVGPREQGGNTAAQLRSWRYDWFLHEDDRRRPSANYDIVKVEVR